MAEVLILTVMCMHIPSLHSIQDKLWFLRLNESIDSQEDGKPKAS